MEKQLVLELDQMEFRGEGNSSLVIALPHMNKVIRLPKYKISEMPSLDTIRSSLENNIRFCQNVLCKLIDASFVEVPEIIYIPGHDIERINELVSNDRLHHRRHKVPPPSGTFALLMTDHCDFSRSVKQEHDLIGPTISIEIKPKQGFVSPLNLTGCCPYSSTQEEKLKLGVINRKSDYCPLDLFSGSKDRMKRAIVSLVDNPQNNLRIFKNAKYSYGEERREAFSSTLSDFIGSQDESICMAMLCELIIQALMAPPTLHERGPEVLPPIVQQWCNEHQPVYDRCEDEALTRCDGVLAAILKLQKLDSIDLELSKELVDFYKVTHAENLDSLQKFAKTSVPLGVGEIEQLEFESVTDYKVRKIWEFLVSLTAKDCSVIITAQKMRQSSGPPKDPQNCLRIVKLSKFSALAKIAIIDLDQKPAWKLERLSPPTKLAGVQ